MVARITTPANILRALNYNEQKVKNGRAVLLYAEGFLKDAEQMNFNDKLRRFKGLIDLNDRAKTNSLHISLNLDISEKIDQEKLVAIAAEYMTRIGFAEQPYLVYEHHDAAHPHIHIVTTNIRTDGSRIDTFNIGRNQSEKARKEIEFSFGLKRAEDSKMMKAYELKPVNVQKAQYGRSETKRAITNVLDAILKDYKYTSLPELNAILKQYNIMADWGSENSRVFQNHGLVYRILDEQGNKVGVPIKASDFYSKPTLTYLEGRFAPNETDRHSHKARVKNAIDLAFLKQPNPQLSDLMNTLAYHGINTVLRQNHDGVIYGLTYVDHRTKCVFNGSILGKQYSAKGILERCIERKEASAQQHDVGNQPATRGLPLDEQSQPLQSPQNNAGIDLLETLLQSEHSSGYVPNGLPGKVRKKRKKRIIKPL